jgi:putative hydrolase of the HAD superfamily
MRTDMAQQPDNKTGIKPEVVLFDLGNTLFFFNGDWQQVMDLSIKAMVKKLCEAGCTFEEPGFLEVFSQRMNEYYILRDKDNIELGTEHILRKLLGEWGYQEISSEWIQATLNAMYAISEMHWQLDDETIPVLKILQDRGYRIGAISNAADANNVYRLIEKANIRSFFETISISASIGFRKPDPRIFQAALKHWDAQPEKSVMVGDTLSADIVGAKRMGMKSVWVTRWANDLTNQDAIDAVVPDATLEKLSDLPGLLEDWQR